MSIVQARSFSQTGRAPCLSATIPAETRRLGKGARGITGAILGAILLFAGTASAREIKLLWEKNPEGNIVEYLVHYGNQSAIYTTTVSAGTQTSHTLTVSQPGPYYFAVTAVNGLNQESDYSNEVFTTVSANSLCDLNGDGTLSAGDVNLLIEVILEKEICPGDCDINGDAKTNILDLQLLGNVVLGRNTCP